MRLHDTWKRLLLGAVLELAALSGVPLRPKDIEHALRQRSGIVSVKQAQQDDHPLQVRRDRT